MRFISVDLPEPDGPMIATYSLRRTARSTPRSARTISPPISYWRVMPRVTMTQSFVRGGALRRRDGAPLAGDRQAGVGRERAAHAFFPGAALLLSATISSFTVAPSRNSRMA